MNLNEYATAEHALKYLAHVDQVPHRSDGEAVLLDFVPKTVRRMLDLGCGDGRLLGLLRIERPAAEGIALDFSPTMLEAAREHFRDDKRIQVVEHNLDSRLPDLGRFDAIVSSFAIHHCDDERKEALYGEIFNALTSGGVFYNLEHVASPSVKLHAHFLGAMGITAEEEDPSNQLASVELQLSWLRTLGFREVDCHWKWLELALFGGVKP